jgi:hypothetical protein
MSLNSVLKSIYVSHDDAQEIISEDDHHLDSWSETAGKHQEWMGDAKRIAVAGYKRVLEDSLDVCSSESKSEYSESVYTPEARSGSEQERAARVRLSTKEADRLRREFGLMASVMRSGITGGVSTGLGVG